MPSQVDQEKKKLTKITNSRLEINGTTTYFTGIKKKKRKQYKQLYASTFNN